MGHLLKNVFLHSRITSYEVQLEENHKWDILPANSTMESQTQQLSLGRRGSFFLLTVTALSVDRLITSWLSTYSSKWKFHEYLVVVADVNRGWQRDLRHIMYKFLISSYKLFLLYWCELQELCFSPFVV